jgi:uncharacterized protein (DUF488 family)
MPAEKDLVIYTVGHSNHELSRLLNLFRRHHVNLLFDVRSAPYSRFAPQFNRQELEKALPAHELRYEFLGQKLGGRPDDPECYDPSGHVIYDRLEQTSEYREGVNEVLEVAGTGATVCLMCSEEDPTVCHRAISIGHFLSELGVRVDHIRRDGHVDEQGELRGSAINAPVQFTLFEDMPVRRSLHPVAPAQLPASDKT